MENNAYSFIVGKREVLISHEDRLQVHQFNWVYNNRNGQICGNVFGRYTTLARFILGINDPDLVADHIDRNKLNCTRENLRIATKSQNMVNKPPISNQYKGVSYCKRTGKFKVYLRHKNKLKCYGYFICPIEAAKKYDEVAYEMFGEFAYLNFKSEI